MDGDRSQAPGYEPASPWTASAQGDWLIEVPPAPVPAGPVPSATPAGGPQFTPPSAPGYWPPPIPLAQPPLPAGAPPTPSRRFGLGALIAVAVVAAGLAGAAGLVTGIVVGHGTGTAPGLSASGDPGSSTVPGRRPTGSVPPTAGALAPGDGTALLARIVPVPAGAQPLTVSGATNGVMDLDQFVKREYPDSPNERGILAARGFQVAAQREWLGTDGVQVHVQVVQFGSALGAESFVLAQLAGYSRDSTVTGQFAVPAATHGQGFERSGLDEAGNRRAILVAQDGPLTVMLFFFTPGAFNRQDEIALMGSQLAALG